MSYVTNLIRKEKIKIVALSILYVLAPMKKKTIRHNQAPFMSSSIQKAIMVKAIMVKFRKKNTFFNQLTYRGHCNFCVKDVKDFLQ